ncbi:MAG: BREX-3 system P-loop-containing protein BrxF [Firmicutes bacterium]|jgi:hypothetical protein|nr:BREX-3 system P-loop-containing protein BrxF [Bacillota bacterium]HOB21374.1 BREX-3 system P-loop-containing protein BrxF [Bacillota bacterium]
MSLEAMKKSIAEAQQYYYHLVLLAGGTRGERTQYFKLLAQKEAYPYINLSLELSEKLLEYASKQRQYQAFTHTREILAGAEEPIVIVDKIELLFSPELNLKPVDLLMDISKYKTLVVSWPGAYKEGILSYGEPGHREYNKADASEIIILKL